MIKIATIIGARPQFIKAATVSRAINGVSRSGDKRLSVTEIIIHTGQHFDDNMSEVFFRELEIPRPAYNLGIGGGTHGQNTGRMIEAIENVLIKDKPDWVMVYGDTDSTLAGALAAAKLHIPVAHVEAGLRSYNRVMPEEINRILTDQLSTILFCPTETAVENLKNEGFPHKLSDNTRQVLTNAGDVMYDAVLHYSQVSEKKGRIMNTLHLATGQYVLATIHREENTDAPKKLSDIMAALDQIASELQVIMPLHPRTRKQLDLLGGRRRGGITFTDPLGYLDMMALEKNAKVIITDSGGVQKEAYFHGVPCVTVREETEWTGLVEAGANLLADSNTDVIIRSFHEMVNRPFKRLPLYGDGHSAEKIVSFLMANPINQAEK